MALPQPLVDSINTRSRFSLNSIDKHGNDMTLFQSNVSGRYKLCGNFTKIYAFPSFTLQIYLQFFQTYIGTKLRIFLSLSYYAWWEHDKIYKIPFLVYFEQNCNEATNFVFQNSRPILAKLLVQMELFALKAKVRYPIIPQTLCACRTLQPCFKVRIGEMNASVSGTGYYHDGHSH